MKQYYFSRKAIGTLLASLVIATLPATGMITPTDSLPFFNRTPFALYFEPDTLSGIADANYSTAIFSQSEAEPIFGAKITVETVSVDRYDNSGTFVRTDQVDSITSVEMRGVMMRNSSKYIFFPDTVVVAYNGKPVRKIVENFSFDYYTPEQSTAQQSFPTQYQLKDVYLPQTTKSVSWRGQDFIKLRNFHFSSSEFPTMSFGDGASGLINIYVPDFLFDFYTNAVKNANYPATVW